METVKRILMFFRCPHWPFKLFKDLIAPVAAVVAAPYTGGASLAVYGAYKGIDAAQQAKKAKAEADRVQAEQQRKAQEQAEVWAQQIAGGSPAGVPSMVPVPAGTAPPVIVQVPTPVPSPQQGMTPLLLLGGAALVAVVLLRR